VADPNAVLPVPVLDSLGNAEGGIRTPYLDVPTGTYFATDTTSAKGFNFCFLFGYENPFSDAKEDTLYTNHTVYLRRPLHLAKPKLLRATDNPFRQSPASQNHWFSENGRTQSFW